MDVFVMFVCWNVVERAYFDSGSKNLAQRDYGFDVRRASMNKSMFETRRTDQNFPAGFFVAESSIQKLMLLRKGPCRVSKFLDICPRKLIA